MAGIIEKAFDTSKNIVRTIFLGKPNLFTTSDLNRQIEAFKYQMDSIENRLGAESDMKIAFDSVGSQTRCVFMKGTYFHVNGLNIPLPNPSEVFAIDAGYGSECYFYVYGNFTRKTYTNDPTHEIAGAKFSDDTSIPAADQLVLSEVHYEMTDDLADITRGDDYFSFIIAKVKVLTTTGSDIYVRLNYKPAGSSVMMDSVPSLEYIEQPEQDDESLKIGDDFNKCINKLLYKDFLNNTAISQLKNKFSPTIQDTPWTQNQQGDISFNYRIKGGMLHIIGFPCTVDLASSRVGSCMGASGNFESSDASALLTYFNKLVYAAQGTNLTFTDSSGARYLFIPLGSCSITGKRNLGSLGEGTHVHGHGEIGLMLSRGEGKFTDILIGSYMTDAICFDSDGKVSETLIGPINRLQLTGTQFTVNAFSAIIPLIE